MVTWNFEEVLLSTIGDKYESEHIKIVEINGVEVNEELLVRQKERLRVSEDNSAGKQDCIAAWDK